MTKQKEGLTIEEVMDMYDVSRMTVYRRAKKCGIVGKRCGRKKRLYSL